MYIRPTVLRVVDPFGDDHSNINIKADEIATYGDVREHGKDGIKFVLKSGAVIYWWIGTLTQTLRDIRNIELMLGIISLEDYNNQLIDEVQSDISNAE